MRTQQQRSLLVTVVTLLLAGSSVLWANGQEFFAPASGPVEFAYVGRVRDASTGRPVKALPYVTVLERTTGLFFPFTGDSPGHFKSPDIGAAIKEVTTDPINPKELEITIIVPGYTTLEMVQAPLRTNGLVELNVKVVPKAGGEAVSAAGNDSAPTGGGINPTAWAALAGIVVMIAIAMVARTTGRQQSAAR